MTNDEWAPFLSFLLFLWDFIILKLIEIFCPTERTERTEISYLIFYISYFIFYLYSLISYLYSLLPSPSGGLQGALSSRFPEVLIDEGDLAGGEEFLGLAVAGGGEGGAEVGVVTDPLNQALYGGRGFEVGRVG